jgi:hypothetical protein
MQKVENNAGGNESNNAMLNQNIEQNTRETRNLLHLMNTICSDIVNMNGTIVELQKKVQKQSFKIENRNEEDSRKDRSEEQRSQNKKEKARKRMTEVKVLRKT